MMIDVTILPTDSRPGANVPPTAPEPALDDEELATLAKALGHPARVKILRFLLSSDACMCGQICDVLPLAQSTVSQHLKVLKRAGLIVGTIEVTRACYAPNRDRLERLKRRIDAL